MALAYLRGLFFKVAGLLIQTVKQRIGTDFRQFQRQLRILFLDFEQLTFQLPAIGEALQAAASAGPVEQQAVRCGRIEQRLGSGDDKRTVQCLGFIASALVDQRQATKASRSISMSVRGSSPISATSS